MDQSPDSEVVGNMEVVYAQDWVQAQAWVLSLAPVYMEPQTAVSPLLAMDIGYGKGSGSGGNTDSSSAVYSGPLSSMSGKGIELASGAVVVGMSVIGFTIATTNWGDPENGMTALLKLGRKRYVDAVIRQTICKISLVLSEDVTELSIVDINIYMETLSRLVRVLVELQGTE
jgi:hypothetical protein